MANPSKPPAALAAIDATLLAYQAPVSDLHRDIRQTLLALRSQCLSLQSLFAQRHADRTSADLSLALTTRARATAMLNAQRTLHAQHQAQSPQNAELLAQSARWLQVAEEGMKVAETHIAASAAQARLQDTADEVAGNWFNGLLACAVDGLRDDASLKKGLAIASGGLIVAGVAGGPLTAIAAALASAALLANDVRQFLTRKERVKEHDAATAREEDALHLLHALGRLCHDWLDILDRP